MGVRSLVSFLTAKFAKECPRRTQRFAHFRLRRHQKSAVPQFESQRLFSDAVILSEAAFQAERRILRAQRRPAAPREIPRPAGENAGLRDDASRELKFELIHYPEIYAL